MLVAGELGATHIKIKIIKEEGQWLGATACYAAKYANIDTTDTKEEKEEKMLRVWKKKWCEDVPLLLSSYGVKDVS